MQTGNMWKGILAQKFGMSGFIALWTRPGLDQSGWALGRATVPMEYHRI